MAKTKWSGMTEDEIREKFPRKWGLVAVAQVVTGEKVAKFTIVPTKGYKATKFANGDVSIKVPLDSLPKIPRIAPNTKEPKLFRILTNEEQDEIKAITPIRGHFPAKLFDLGPRPEKDSDPTPKEKVFDEGGKDEERHLEFFAVYKIVDGVWKGTQLPAYWLHYKFMESSDDEGFTKYAFNVENPQATRGQQLRKWMQVHHLEDELVPWDDDTILPVLLERALDNDDLVEVNIEDGYILKDGGVVPFEDQGFVETPSDESVEDEEEVDEVEKEFPKKSAPAKEAKKPVKKISKKHDDEDEDL